MAWMRRLGGWMVLSGWMLVTATLVVVASHREKGWSETGTIIYEIGFVAVLTVLPIVIGLLVSQRGEPARRPGLASLAIIAAGSGLLIGRPLAEFNEPGPVWTAEAAFPLALVVIGLAVWNLARFGIGKLTAIALLAFGGLLFTVYDVGSGPPVWDREYVGIELFGIWLFCMSAIAVMLATAVSVLTERPVTGRTDVQQVVEAERPEWWRGRGLVVTAAVALLWGVGFVVSNVERLDASREHDEEELGVVEPEQFFVDPDGGGDGTPTVHVIKTFRPLDRSDVDDVGGRLVWDDAEVELCAVEIRAVGDGFVQIGDIFSANQDCDGDTRVRDAFDDNGLPPTACLHVRSNGVDDEFCAPLAVDDSGETDADR